MAARDEVTRLCLLEIEPKRRHVPRNVKPCIEHIIHLNGLVRQGWFSTQIVRRGKTTEIPDCRLEHVASPTVDVDLVKCDCSLGSLFEFLL